MKEKKRIEWLDILKGICMFFIVLSHSQPPVVYIRFYTPFFLAGFFFCSGYTFSAREDFTHFLLHKARTILVPYWGFGLINAVLAYIADGDNLCDRIIGLLLSINQRNDDLWFVMCLFTMEIIFYLLWILLFKDYEARRSSLLIIAVGGFALSFLGYAIVCLHIRLLFQFETALIMLPFMLMGYVWKKETKVNAVQKPHKIMGGGYTTAVCMVVYLILVFAVENIVNIHAESYSNFLLFLLSGILGTVMIVLVSRQIEILMGDCDVSKCLIFIGQNTFVYYAFQSKAIRLIDLLYNKAGFQINDYLRNPLYALAVCLVLAIPAVIVNRWFPFLMGRKS